MVRGELGSVRGFVSMEALRSEAADEVLVLTRWESRDAFDAWVGSERSCAHRPHGAITKIVVLLADRDSEGGS